jgi:hypothetical protein
MLNVRASIPISSASKVRRCGLNPAELRAHDSYPQSHQCVTGLRFRFSDEAFFSLILTAI